MIDPLFCWRAGELNGAVDFALAETEPTCSELDTRYASRAGGMPRTVCGGYLATDIGTRAS